VVHSLLLMVSPSSQSSTPLCIKPSLQRAVRHSPTHESVSLALPSSHSSPSVMTLLPQAVSVQLESQPSPSTALPSSHASGSCSTRSPQIASPQAPSHKGSSARLSLQSVDIFIVGFLFLFGGCNAQGSAVCRALQARLCLAASRQFSGLKCEQDRCQEKAYAGGLLVYGSSQM
jgi:hypothetical protein